MTEGSRPGFDSVSGGYDDEKISRVAEVPGPPVNLNRTVVGLSRPSTSVRAFAAGSGERYRYSAFFLAVTQALIRERAAHAWLLSRNPTTWKAGTSPRLRGSDS